MGHSGKVVEKFTALSDLLADLFSDHELRRWLQELDPALPNKIGVLQGPLSELTFSVVNTLHKHGMIDADFFERLTKLRSRRIKDIDNVRLLFVGDDSTERITYEDIHLPSGDLDIIHHLAHEDARRHLLAHPLLDQLREADLPLRDMEFVVGQYWHPIRYFTEFLTLCLTGIQVLDIRSRISSILYQELGEGNPKLAHESLFLKAANRAGIPPEVTQSQAPLGSTQDLLKGFRYAAKNRGHSLGYLYATELIDLDLVRSLGAALAHHSGGASSEWLRIHTQQESDHVAKAHDVVSSSDREESQAILGSARDAWRRWNAFYDGIEHGLSRR